MNCASCASPKARRLRRHKPLGSVKVETRNEGRGLREWDYVPLGEERVVSELLQRRSK